MFGSATALKGRRGHGAPRRYVRADREYAGSLARRPREPAADRSDAGQHSDEHDKTRPHAEPSFLLVPVDGPGARGADKIR